MKGGKNGEELWNERKKESGEKKKGRRDGKKGKRRG